MKIQILKPTENELKRNHVLEWPVWEKEVSRFPWAYEGEEHCYITEGEITVETEQEVVHIVPGDFVIFPAGLKCVWDIRKNVKKHYHFAG